MWDLPHQYKQCCAEDVRSMAETWVEDMRDSFDFIAKARWHAQAILN